MKLLLISESPLEKIGDEYFAVDPWIQFPLKLAEENQGLTILSPVVFKNSGEIPSPDSWLLKLGNMKIAPLEPYHSFLGFFKKWLFHRQAWKKRLTGLIQEHDILLIRCPSPMLTMAAKIAVQLNKPFVPLLAGNMATQSDRIQKSRGLIKVIYRIIVAFFVQQEKKVCQNAALIFSYSKELSSRYTELSNKIILMRTPHISEKDFFIRKDTCQNSVIQILRVCWLLPTKGLESLFEAVAGLLKKGYSVRLKLIGKEREPGYQNYLQNLVEKLSIKDYVEFSGWLPYDKMERAYRESDIQVVSSLSEGTPRVILEGGARGLPLVTTDVGGIKDVLTHEKDALLIKPGNAEAMAQAIERIIKEPELRQSLICNGYEATKSSSFESLGLKVLNELRKLVKDENTKFTAARN